MVKKKYIGNNKKNNIGSDQAGLTNKTLNPTHKIMIIS
jgi:hypothetical protein